MIAAKEFREMTREELDRRIGELRKELFSLRFQLATGQLEQTNLISSLKRDIARGLTVRRELVEQTEEQ